ncbi:LEAF RUST 10 DISEASE-RESISTANCE LOCUS RECEPTOR-LIKE PROTEIN KINASE-like 1.2 isoform X1 [Vicia villosa]|uniref:LEAF RUST 10 DISEASE-RESISTANCE LOCUS RECEPTOR-LIKE PROTEIN KINASE-like 1.2 isoform X1 n=1 Tax=Vicia villosa TaxID=3911 RepID=UPI00273B3CD4|nr:LEAF RUST 10 DISEASE-RESISTANCE LOCUS RECEPTOR-LIKE PROTEIN KINASE-like 1.2 isoform X1 [Vicia villosa]
MASSFLQPHCSFLFNIFLFLLFFLFPIHVNSDAKSFKLCAPFTCGSFTKITYPFWNVNNQPNYCGHPNFTLDCQQNNLTIDINSQQFHIIDINQASQLLKIARLDLWSYDAANVPSCPDTNVNLNSDFFKYTSNDENYTLLSECDPFPNDSYGSSPLRSEVSQQISCLVDSKPQDAYLVLNTKMPDFAVLDCKNDIKVYGPRIEESSDTVVNVLKEGFEVTWSGVDDDICNYCKKYGGRCGYNTTKSAFMCICPNQQSYGDCGFCRENSTTEIWPDESGCIGSKLFKSVAPSPLPASSYGDTPFPELVPPPNSDSINSRGTPSKQKLTRNLVIGVGSAVLVAFAAFIAIYFYKRRKNKNKTYAKSYVQSRSLSSELTSKDLESGSQFFERSQNFGVQHFTYSELEEATNFFDPSKELGEGGFGTVYYGKLYDGRSVAVKRLFENNYKRVEQFKNEVEILASLVHPNLVSLYGCTSRHSRELLLVYEYVSNGTVADHLRGKEAKHGKLTWPIRMNIAVETASALKYLHISEIIHRDIKTNNILLDAHFHVKVADFGLSRLFPYDQTHVSTAPQGTPGYVDPEYHQCYQLTDKSDVYSFGVVMIELISSLPAVDITRHRHEINLASMALNRIQNQALHEIVDPTLGFESDSKVKKMIVAMGELAFQCLQSSKDMRPTMDEVLDSLKDIQSDGKHKSKPEVMDISNLSDDAVLLNNVPPPLSPDSNVRSNYTTPNTSG